MHYSCAHELEIYADGEKRALQSKLVLNSEYHKLVFLFPAMKGKQYRFRLHGLEKDWQKSTYPVARYTNLNGGNYRFEGEIRNGNNTIRRYETTIEIKEDFWEKWWFWLFVATVIISFVSIVIYFWFLYDFRQRMKVQEIRQRIAADLHDEVGANLSSITFFVELLRKKITGPETDLNTILEKISRNSQESAALINDTIWALNPDYDSFEKMVEKMKSFAAEILAARDIALTFQPAPDMKFDLGIDQRRDIYLIFKEAINNAAKHSEANQVIVKMAQINGSLEILVEDNGIGFDPVGSYEGNGLKNYDHRSRIGEAQVKVDSKPGKGTTISIQTNLQNHQN
ncbi:MAG TPA: histidine kinase [Dyadobacter sp.]|jgi:signal transduction histidine kinase|nr:histidine kinase [Dyadobacter sp.]